MKRQIVIESFQCFQEVHFFSVRFLEDGEFITAEFMRVFKNHALHGTHAAIIFAFIRQMGKETGAQAIFFRPEDEANALPPDDSDIIPEVLKFNNDPDIQEELHTENCLRLFCLRVTENIVLLFSGHIKDAQSNIACSRIFQYHFQLAKAIAKAFKKELNVSIIPRKKKLLHNGPIILEIELKYEKPN